MAKQALDGSRFNGFFMDPDKLVIIGLDTKDGPEHALYDPRIHLPLVEETVQDIMDRGVRETILVRKQGDQVQVVFGRQRVKMAREVKRRQLAKGTPADELIQVPCTVTRENDADAMTDRIAENRHRTANDVLADARELQRYLDFGHTKGEALVRFKISESTYQNWLTLLQATPEVQASMVSGAINQEEALKLAKKPVEEQKKRAAEPKKPRRFKHYTVAARKEIARIVSKDTTLDPKIKAILEWVTGALPAESLCEVLGVKVRAKVAKQAEGAVS